MIIPRFADHEIAPMIATGIAIMRGHGVATTRTARNLWASPEKNQAASAIPTATGV